MDLSNLHMCITSYISITKPFQRVPFPVASSRDAASSSSPSPAAGRGTLVMIIIILIMCIMVIIITIVITIASIVVL